MTTRNEEADPLFRTWRVLHDNARVVWKLAMEARYYALTVVFYSVGLTKSGSKYRREVAWSSLGLFYHINNEAIDSVVPGFQLPECGEIILYAFAPVLTTVIEIQKSVVALIDGFIIRYFDDLNSNIEHYILPPPPGQRASQGGAVHGYGFFAPDEQGNEPSVEKVKERTQRVQENNKFMHTYDKDVRISISCILISLISLQYNIISYYSNPLIYEMIRDLQYHNAHPIWKIMQSIYSKYPALIGHQILPWQGQLPPNTVFIFGCGVRRLEIYKSPGLSKHITENRFNAAFECVKKVTYNEGRSDRTAPGGSSRR
jgi:hypothetical protein